MPQYERDQQHPENVPRATVLVAQALLPVRLSLSPLAASIHTMRASAPSVARFKKGESRSGSTDFRHQDAAPGA